MDIEVDWSDQFAYTPIMLARSSAASRPNFLSPRERAALSAVARAMLPKGAFFPGAGDRCIEKVEGFLAASPASVGKGYRAMLWALEASALLHHRRTLAQLEERDVLGLLERWRT